MTKVIADDFAPVSVVIPCYQCSDSVAFAVASVFAQTLQPREVLLIDDGSGDGTVEELERIATAHADGRVKVFKLGANQGPSRARNVGWMHARSDYIAFLDADDSWAPSKLELQMAAVLNDPQIALISHRMSVQPRSSAPPLLRLPIRTRVVSRRRLLFGNPFQTPSVMLRRDLPFRFNEDFRRVEDFLLWAQIAFSGYRCVKINQTLAVCHKANFGAGGLSADLGAMHQAGREVRRELIRQGLMSRQEYCLTLGVGAVRRTRRNLLMVLRRARSSLSRSV